MCWNSVLTYLHISSGAYSCSRMLSKQIVLQFSHINALESMGWLICTTYRSPESFQHNGGNLSIVWPSRKSLVWVFTQEKRTTIQKEEKRKRLKKIIITNISSTTEEIWASSDHRGSLWCEFHSGEENNNPKRRKEKKIKKDDNKKYIQRNGGNLSIFWPPRKSLVWAFTSRRKRQQCLRAHITFFTKFGEQSIVCHQHGEKRNIRFLFKIWVVILDFFFLSAYWIKM